MALSYASFFSNHIENAKLKFLDTEPVWEFIDVKWQLSDSVFHLYLNFDESKWTRNRRISEIFENFD